jgi:hypothetical protein
MFWHQISEYWKANKLSLWQFRDKTQINYNLKKNFEMNYKITVSNQQTRITFNSLMKYFFSWNMHKPIIRIEERWNKNKNKK